MDGTLPVWLENWLQVDAADSGEGTAWTLESHWPWSPSVSVILVVVLALWFSYWYAKERSEAGRFSKALLATLRLAAVGLVLFMIAEFSLSLHRTGLPYVAVLVDDSASMNVADHYPPEVLARLAEFLEGDAQASTTRLQLAKRVLLKDDASLLAQLQDQFRLRLYFMSTEARQQPDNLAQAKLALENLDAQGSSSRLGHGIQTALNDLRGTPPAALVILSDGINTEGLSLEEASALAANRGVPVFSVGFGRSEAAKDTAITDVMVDEIVFLDDVVYFEYQLAATGFAGREVQVVLHTQDSDAVLASEKVTLGEDGQPVTRRLAYRPEREGEFEFVLEVKPPAEDTQESNNRAVRRVSVRKEKIRVLLVSAMPTFEFKFLKHLLERDRSAIELNVVLQEADLDYAKIDSSALEVFPAQRDALFAYDVILFGDVNPEFLGQPALENLADFVVEKGGGVVFMAGPRYTPQALKGTPVEALLPIDMSRLPEVPRIGQDPVVIRPTGLGLASPALQIGNSPAETEVTWASLRPIAWYQEIPALKRGAQVLAEHPTKLGEDGRPLALFCMQFVGAGKVLFHATDETWRWRIRTGDLYLARYWIQTIRYLSRGKLLGQDRPAELTVLSASYQSGDNVRLRARFLDDRSAPVADDGVEVVIERQGFPNQNIKLQRVANQRGVFEGELPAAAAGKYHARMSTPPIAPRAPSVDFEVLAPPGERERIAADSRALQLAAEVTHGRYYDWEDSAKLASNLPEGKQVPIQGLPPIVIWNRWPILALVLLLLVGEWILRKRHGMA